MSKILLRDRPEYIKIEEMPKIDMQLEIVDVDSGRVLRRSRIMQTPGVYRREIDA